MKERSFYIGPRNLYIADWHYGHANVIGHDNRPFQTLKEMNEALVTRWNDAVRPEDTVYVLGDMFWSRAREAVGILRTLNGKKVLIRGDHDNTRDSEFCKEVILEVFTALWEILSLYGISDGYNCRPDTGSLEGAEEYFGAMLKSARETVGRLETPRNAPGPLYCRWQLNQLLRLIDETELFVKSYSVPGVGLRWRKINPRLNYYDPVFNMVEELSPEAWRRLWDMFGYRPTKWDFQMRQRYFSGQKEQREHFQRELLDTLEKLFHNDFFEVH